MGNGAFVSDIEAIKKRARENMMQGPVTSAYGADVKQVVTVLNDVLATEIVCTLRYWSHYFLASGMNAEAVKAEFAEHAREEQEHASRVAERITQLGGTPNLDPATLSSRSHADFKETTDLVEMVKEDLIAERVAIETYLEIARWLGDRDPTTRRLIESVLEQEEEHADDMQSLLEKLGPR